MRTGAGMDKESPLSADIRLLGRLLGDAVREREGDEVFGIVERIRQISVRFARENEASDQAELAALLEGLPRDTMMRVVRAFSYFLHLANIAEDQHHIRRRRAHDIAGSPARPGSFARALRYVQFEIGVRGGDVRAQVEDFLEHALVSPVLTAHPTEVQRKSILQSERKIASLLDARDRMRLTPEEKAENDAALARVVLTLWETRMLRPTRLAVVDEVKNGISYFEDTFFTELPRLYCQMEDELNRQFPVDQGKKQGKGWQVPPFFRVGSWIGGDRDGNPFVTADILRKALRLQSSATFDFYLEQIHELGADLPISQLLAPVSPELAALAERSPDRSPHRVDEPYRRALTGIYARVAATSRALDAHESLRHAVGNAEPYRASTELEADLHVLADSLEVNGLSVLEGLRKAGINIPAIVILVLMVSGAIAGLAGASEVAGRAHRLDPTGLAVGFGYTGIIVAALARYEPLAVIPFALFIGGLANAGSSLQTLPGGGVPSAITMVLQGAILIFVLASEVLLTHRVTWRWTFGARPLRQDEASAGSGAEPLSKEA